MRRLLWCAVLLAWPVDLAAQMMWGAPWATDLTDWLAPAAVLLGVGLLVTARAEAPRLRDWRRKREIRDLRDDVAELQRWQAAHEEQAAQKIAQLDCVTEGFTRVFAATNHPAPQAWDANAPTDPGGLRIVS